MKAISFNYYLDKALMEMKEEPNGNEEGTQYTLMCLKALESKASTSKSLDIIFQEMKKVVLEKTAYQMAYEDSVPKMLDVSFAHNTGPMVKTDDTWSFMVNQILIDAMKKYDLDIRALPDYFSLADKEQLAQHTGLSFHDYCALPYVRSITKKNLYKMLSQAEREERTTINADFYQEYHVTTMKQGQEIAGASIFQHCTNHLIRYLFPENSMFDPPTRINDKSFEQIRQMRGGAVIQSLNY